MGVEVLEQAGYGLVACILARGLDVYGLDQDGEGRECRLR
jgi:hypothetical protein